MNNFHELVGKTITKISGVDTDRWTFKLSTGERFLLMHIQDCCESVRHERTIGNIENIIGVPIILAEEDSKEPEWFTEKFIEDSHTFTAFYFETEKGRVEIWFLGESNGYYGESFEFRMF